LAQQRRLRNQSRGIAFDSAGASGHQLADLRLRVARDGIAMALLDELHAAFERLRRRGAADRHKSEHQRYASTDQDDPQQHAKLRLSILPPEASALLRVTSDA